MKILLEIDKVRYGYGSDSWLLRDISLNVAPGELLGIIGPNGAGKSTLLKIAAGVLHAQSGNVVLGGKILSGLSRREIARQMGYLPQSITSTFDYRVEEVVAMGRFAHLLGAGFLGDKDLEIVEQCMERTETTAYRKRHLSHLSGGERQRVLLASVLAQQPEILLLDEPTTGLDMHHQVSFFSLLCDLSAKGMAIAVVTHDLNLAAMFCTRLFLMCDGGVVRSGSVEEVINQEVLDDVYRQSVYVGSHPMNGRPMVLPIGGSS